MFRSSIVYLFILAAVWFAALFIFSDKLLSANIGLFTVSVVFKNSARTHTSRPCCLNFPSEASEGYWKMRSDLTPEEIKHREKMDENIRISNNWPPNLFRNDSRCGKNYPIPGYRIQSLCDEKSSRPCCNTKTGECGISADHCTCPECTDLRDMKSAELLEWVPRNPACSIKNFTTEEACQLFNRFRIRLAFVGDSFIRQLATVMILLLSGNFQSGAMPVNSTQSNRKKCEGEFQITEKDCSIYIVAHSVNELPSNSICKGKQMIMVESVQDYTPRIREEVYNKTREMLGQEDSYVIFGVGMHYYLRSDLVIKELKKFLDYIETQGNGWPNLIWVELHSLNGFLRIDTKFHNDRIKAFNTEVNEFLELRNITVLRTFNMSNDLKSYDGQHYGIGFNLHKINMILSFLENKYEIC